MTNKQTQPTKQTLPIGDRIKNVLEETRIVLPGTQALLGFQLACVFQTGFAKISRLLQELHLASLLSITLAIIFLLSVAAYDRIADKNQDSERFHKFASWMILFAMIFLGLGLSGDLYVITQFITTSSAFSLIISLITLAICYVLWFVFTTWQRKVISKAR